MLLDLPNEVAIADVNKVLDENNNVKRQLSLSQHIQRVNFNLDIFLEQQCLIDFRFKQAHIGRLAAQ